MTMPIQDKSSVIERAIAQSSSHLHRVSEVIGRSAVSIVSSVRNTPSCLVYLYQKWDRILPGLQDLIEQSIDLNFNSDEQVQKEEKGIHID